MKVILTTILILSLFSCSPVQKITYDTGTTIFNGKSYHLCNFKNAKFTLIGELPAHQVRIHVPSNGIIKDKK